jgi:hypothetical protein
MVDIKLSIIVLVLLALPLLYIKYRQKIVAPAAIAFIIAFFWTLYFRYEYTNGNLFLFNRINIYPLILWTVGLTALHLLTVQAPKKHRLATGLITYFFVLALVESFGYHVFQIRLASNYTSLLGLGVIHAPLSMKIFYIFAGPLYLSLMNIYERKLASSHKPLFRKFRKRTHERYAQRTS